MKSIITFTLWACVASATTVCGGEKTVQNQTNTNITLSALERDGDDPAKSAGMVTIEVKAKGSANLSYDKEFLNAVSVSWTTNGTDGYQTQEVATRSSAWDGTLNVNSRLTITSVSLLDATGSNTNVSSAGGSKKKIVNGTGKTLEVFLFTRDGDDPVKYGKAAGPVEIAAGGSALISYSGPFLNGMGVTWKNDSDSSSRKNATVSKRGSDWDDTLNKNDTVTINSVSTLDLTGSN
tara:strand:- start:3465 stop:4172 length:708 start_codon:yes stop_codon:yes gene_type:complete